MNFNEDKSQPTANRVEGDNNIDQKDLERTFLFGKGDNPAHPTEGQGTGGQNFGGENLTPAGNDKNNPTQMAGHTNAYFDRNEPSEEHPEDSNFTAKNQDGAPDYNKYECTTDTAQTNPKPEKHERGDGENDRPHEQEPYVEGTVDDDGTDGPNIPGPQELPDQQKVGEDENEESEK
jgi:hypothetical protein